MMKPSDSELDAALVKRAATAARSALEGEIFELKGLLSRLDIQIERALAPLLNCHGRVIVTGIGKPGHIGVKISATFSSTGTPSFFLHATEALHGDSGVLMKGDLLLAISNSGETTEVCAIAKIASDFGIPVIAMVGKTSSTLAQIADVVLDVGVSQEADPLNLAPTASTTLALVLGDALASALMAARNFTAADFARHHPAGSLGKQLTFLDAPAGAV